MSLFTKKYLKKMKKSNNEEIWVIKKGQYSKLFPDENERNISSAFIDEIMANDDFYNYCLNRLSNNHPIRIYKSNSELSYSDFSKLNIINALIKNEYRYYSLKSIKKIEELFETVSYSCYLEKIANTSVVTGNKEIKVKDIMDLLSSTIIEKDFITQLNQLNITINDLMEILQRPPFFLYHNYRLSQTSILKGYNFPEDIKQTILENVNYLSENSYLFNRLPNSNYYVLDIIDFFKNNNVEEYKKENDTILGYSFPEIAIYLNNYLLGIDIEHDTLSKERNIFTFTFIRSLPQELQDTLTEFVDKYIPDPLAEKEFSAQNNYSDVEVDEELINQILKEIPENYTDFQKVYFIYKYVCAHFVYDPYYLAGSQKEKYDINHHKQKESVKNINLVNNNVVCYDISVIIAKLIERLGHPVQLITSDGKKLNDYGSRHAAVKTKVGEYWIMLDIANGLIHNDMTFQQLTGQVNNFSILNIVKRTCLKAEQEMEEVDRDFNEKYDSYKKHVKALDEYKSRYANNDSVSFEEKVQVVISSVLDSQIDDTSKILYVKDVINMVFGGKDDKCFIAFVGSKINTILRNEIALGCILICDERGVLNNESDEGKRYYLFPNLREYKELTKKQIEDLISNKKIIGIRQLEIDLVGLDQKLYYEDEGR